jgi:hypothetical protein
MDQYSLLAHSANDEVLATRLIYILSQDVGLLAPETLKMWQFSSKVRQCVEPYPITIAYHLPLQHVLSLFPFDIGIKIVHIAENEHFYPPQVIAHRKQTQGKGVLDGEAEMLLRESIHKARVTYLTLINRGVDPQVASLCLPQSIYVDCHLTGDIHTWASLILKLKDSQDPEEAYIKTHVMSMYRLIKEVYPQTMKVLGL